jgi:nicotinate-nucleotide adenylyltransferase
MYDIEGLREYVKGHLSKKRYEHCLGVEQAAVRLAVLNGVSLQKASVAALLHDVTKELSGEIQLQLCDEFGIILDDVERHEPKILHPITGAYFAKTRLNIEDEDILNAIRHHTTARKGMSLLEKIIYLADFIEPNRSFDGCDQLRAIAYTDLDRAMVDASIMAVNEVSLKRRLVHKNSLDALNEHLLIVRKKEKEV